MPLTGSPPTYTRGFSFTQHSTDLPNVPQPGDKLDQEFDDIATAVNEGNTALQGITNEDGTLQDHSVGMDQLEPGLFDQIITNAEAELQPMVDAAQNSASLAVNANNAAQIAAADAANYAASANGSVVHVDNAKAAANAAAADAADSAAEAAISAAAAENSATTAEGAMVNSGANAELAFNWAEYLAGPVAPAPPGWPEAIDDGLWSAKWWAVRAREIVGDYGNWYLGAFPVAPGIPSSGAWPPGSMYYDTALGLMMVWTGTAWKPLTTPAPAAKGMFVYIATAGQQAFAGSDLYGATPAMNTVLPESVAVQLNGVRLVEDKNGTGDYTLDVASSTVTLSAPVGAGAVLQWDVYLSPASLAPGAVLAHKLTNPWPFDGVATNFPMTYMSPVDGTTQPVVPGDGVQITLQFDGVQQEPGADYTTAGSSLVFAQPPAPDAKCWGVWMQPGVGP